jgi:predicted outer membrane protein
MGAVRLRSLCHGLGVAAVASAALLFFDPRMASAAEPVVPVPPNGLLTDKAQGDLSAADKDLVVKVRLAGLWEMPAGKMAQEKSNDRRIQQVGADIAEQHATLDQLARDAAKKLDIDLPDEPNADQQKWLSEMRAADEGEAFDQVFIDRLRAAHGKIFPAIATVRTSTRNDTVRKLAQQANQFVMTHLTLLESSGIVDYKALPTAPAPNASAAPVLAAADANPSLSSIMPLLVAALGGGLAAGIFTTRQVMRARRRVHLDRWSAIAAEPER